MKLYFAVNENDGSFTHIRVELYYRIGGMDSLTNTYLKCGYYLNVFPVKISNHSESYTALNIIKKCVKLSKYNKKHAAAEAEKIALTEITALIDNICQKHNLTLTESAQRELCETAKSDI